MEDTGTGTLSQARTGTTRHWIVFALLLLVAFLVSAGAHTEWASPAGFVLAPAGVRYFIVRRGTSAKNLSGRYAAFIVILAFLVSADVIRESEFTKDSVSGGCLDNNPWVAQLPRDEDRQSFCGSLADRMVWPVMRNPAPRS